MADDADGLEDDGGVDFDPSQMRSANSYGTWKDKPIAERGWACDALAAAGFRVQQLTSSGKGEDPPDCRALISGEVVGIEVTELVDDKLLKRNISARERNDPSAVQYRIWDQELLVTELQKIIARKENGHWKGGPFARKILVIHTSEFTLTAKLVSELLVGQRFQTQFFSDVVLALQYEPDFDIPAFRLPLDKVE